MEFGPPQANVDPAVKEALDNSTLRLWRARHIISTQGECWLTTLIRRLFRRKRVPTGSRRQLISSNSRRADHIVPLRRLRDQIRLELCRRASDEVSALVRKLLADVG